MLNAANLGNHNGLIVFCIQQETYEYDEFWNSYSSELLRNEMKRSITLIVATVSNILEVKIK